MPVAGRRQVGQRRDQRWEAVAEEEQEGLVAGAGEHDVQQPGPGGERRAFGAVEVVAAQYHDGGVGLAAFGLVEPNELDGDRVSVLS